MTAVQPFLVHTRAQRARAAELRRHRPVLRRHLPAVQRAPACRSATSSAAGCRTRPNLDEWASKIDENTRFLYGELPSNPRQGFFDIAAVADLAHSHNLPLICDSTVATPALLRPICHGADIVVQSVTKTLTHAAASASAAR